MQNAMTLGKRAFTIAVAAATILWSISASAFVAPLSASAETSLSNGDLIKGSLSTVYYFYDDERWTFPNEKTFYTWYADFDDVMTVSDSQLASYPLAGNIVVRSGTWMVKVDTDPKTYVVTRDGEIRWVETEEVAVDLYGEDWNQWIIDVPDVFFTDYSEGSSMMSAEFVDGMQVVDGSDVYLIWDGEKSMVTSAGMSANRLMSKFQITDSSVDLADYSTGSSISSEVASLSDTSQQATGSAAVSGDLMLSVSNDSPEGQTVPRSAMNVKLFAVDLEAGDADVDVSNIVFSYNGVAPTTLFDNLYVYWNGARLTSGKTVNSTTRTVTFSSLDVTVEAGESETIWLTGDVDDSAFGTASVSFSVASADNVTSTAASIDGDFPVAGGSNTLTSAAEVGTITIDETGSLSDVVIGEEDAEIARFTLAASNEDAMLTNITMNVDKATDHSEYELWQSSTKLADGVSVGNDLVLFELEDAYTVADGNTKTFKITATIGGDPNDVIATALEETGDLTAIGGDFGFGMFVTNNMNEDGTTACAAVTDECSRVTIIGGKLTFAFNGPSSATDLQIGGDNQVLMDFTLTSQNAATLRSIEFDVTMTDVDDGTDANFENFRIVKEDGSTLMGPEEITVGGATTQAIVFNDEFDLAAGDSMELSLVVDISDVGDAVAGDTIVAVMDSSETSAEDSSGNTLTVGTDIIPSANLTGNTFTLTDATLTINLAGAPSSATVVTGSQDVDMVGFTFAAGEASDIVVSSATFDVTVDSDGDDTFDEATGDLDAFTPNNRITSCSIYDGDGVLIDGPEALDSNGDVDFNGFSWTVPAGSTEKLVVNCDFANLSVVATPDEYAVEIDAAADITAEDEDGDQITPTITDGNTGDTIEIAVVASGTLTQALAGSSPDATIIIGSSTDVTVGVFRFTAATESFIVDTIELENGGNDRAASSVSVSYKNQAGETKTKKSVFAGGEADFEGLEIYVPATGTADLTVTVDTSAVSTSGATSGDTLVITLDAEASQYTGVSSGSTTTDSGTDAAAATFTLRKTKPTLSKASGSPSGSGIPGLDEVLRFNIAADSHGYVTVDELTFKLTSTDNNGSDWNDCDSGMATTDWTIYNVDDLSDALEAADTEWVLLDSSLGACSGAETLSYVILDLATSVEIAAGSTETFAVYFDTTGASSSQDDTIRLDIPIDSEVATIGGGTDPDGSIIWDDDTQGSDIDGTNVKTLPVSGGTIIY